MRISFLTILLLPSVLLAQPDSLWSELYGNNYRNDCRTAILLESGDYLLAGFNHSPFDDVMIVRADSAGNALWTRIYGRPFGNDLRNDENAYSVAERADGSYLVGGSSDKDDGSDTEGMMMAISPDGDSLWTRFYSGTNISKVFSTPDDGFIAAGRDRPNFWMFKADSAGEVEWEHIYDNGGFDNIQDAIQGIDGGYLLAGQRGSQIYALKTDSLGEQEWWRLYESDSLSIHCYGVSSTSDGGFILTGIGHGRLDHGYSLRIDEDGEVLWDATYGYGGAWFHSCVQTSDGGFVFGGEDSGIHLGQANQFYVVRTDENGEQLWEADYGEGGDRCKAVLSTPDGGYAFAGVTNTYHYDRQHTEMAGLNFWLVKSGPDPLGNGVELLDPAFPSLFVVGSPYPNPFNSSVKLDYALSSPSLASIRVYNQLGHQIAELYNGRLEAGQHTVTWGGYASEHAPISSGVYLVCFVAGSQVITSKMTLIR